MYESRRFLEKGCLDLLPLRAWGAFSGGDELWEPRHGGYEPVSVLPPCPAAAGRCFVRRCRKSEDKTWCHSGSETLASL